MPYSVGQGHGCPTNKSWAVFNSDTGKVHGCHATKAQALKQQAALYVNVPDAGAGVMTDVIDREANDPEGDPVELAQGIDAVLDEVDDALDSNDVPTAQDLLTAAEATCDELIQLLGGTDADDANGDNPNPQPQGTMSARAKPDPGSFAIQDPNNDGVCDHCGQPASAHKSGGDGGGKPPVNGQQQKSDRAVGTVGGSGISNLPDSSFAYIEPGGTKDDQGKTTPRSLRHFPIKDANGKCDPAHVRNALARAPQSPFGSKALPKINACARQLGIGQPAQKSFELPTDDIVRACYPGPQFRVRSEDGSATIVGDWSTNANQSTVDPKKLFIMQQQQLPRREMFGHFAVFNTWSEINSLFEGTFLERIAPGAFKRTFKNNRDSMRAIFQHGRDPQIGDKPLGVISELEEDSRGAAYSVDLLDAPYVRDIVEPGLAAGLYGASFRFRVVQEEMNSDPGESEWNPKGLPERTIKEAQVREFGPVTYPAYPEATAGVRSMTDELLLSNPGDMLRSVTDRIRAELGGVVYDAARASNESARSCGCAACEHQDVEHSTPGPDLRTTVSTGTRRDYLVPKEGPSWRLP